MREIHALERRSRDVVRAAQVIPNLAVAVQEAVYNAVDARARSIKVWADVPSGSFSVADDGDGMAPEGLFKFIGECVGTFAIFQLMRCEVSTSSTVRPHVCAQAATSRLASSHSDSDKRRRPACYGKRGEFLHALGTLASVEIESRVEDQWTAHRKLIQEGTVVFNARSKVFRKGHGTTVTARKLFNCLPVRAKDVQNNPRYCAKLIKEIQTFCVNLSMIWPTLSLELVFENNPRQSLRISGVSSCRERFVKMFGSAIGNELEYVDFSPADSRFAVRGYFALIQDSWEVSPAGLKQARAYYQYVFFQNQWIESFHQECAKRITQLALDLNIGIPIFVLKVDCPSAEFALLWAENGKCVELKSPQSFDRLLCDLIQTLKVGVDSATDIVTREQETSAIGTKDKPLSANGDRNEKLWSENGSYQLPADVFEEPVPYCEEEPEADFRIDQLPAPYLSHPFEHAQLDLHDDDLVLYEVQNQDDQDWNGFHQEHPDERVRYPVYEEEEGDQLLSILPQAKEPETIFHVQDARTNWGELAPAGFTEDEVVAPYFSAVNGADLCSSCESCGHVNTWRDRAREYLDDEGWEHEGEYEEAECDYEIALSPVSHPQELEDIDIDDTSLEIHHADAKGSCHGALPSKAPDVDEGELASVFFTDSKVPKLAGDPKPRTVESQDSHGNDLKAQHWITSRSLKTELDGALEVSPLRLRSDAAPLSVPLKDQAKKRPRQCCSKYFSASGTAAASPVALSKARYPRKPRTFSAALPRTSKCTLRVDNVGELKQLRNFKIPKSVLDTLEVIRQVDRKFILVRATDHTSSSFANLLLCIDQHAADERVKLERLELELFGPDGDELNINVSEFAQPPLILLNAKEFQTLAANEDIVRVWGFDFEFLESEAESSRFTSSLYTSMEYGATVQEDDGEYYVELRTTPKVDTRCASVDDFREFIQILSQNEGFWSWSVMRPPVITRLLHSRACRSAIMFGDYLSVSQCRELVGDLRKCKLPFQCAHGRPSVVPLVEFLTRE